MHKGFILWFTGLSGAGKSTLGEMLVDEFRSRGYRVELLDGDVVRTNLSKGLGFSKEDRDINIRRIGFVANTAAISPYREIRDEIRNGADAPFVEAFVSCPLEALVERDTKGLYKKAIAGEIKNFTGVSDPYEPPLSPEIALDTATETIEESRAKILACLSERSLIGD